VAAPGESCGDLLDVDLGAAAFRVGQVTPVEDENLQGGGLTLHQNRPLTSVVTRPLTARPP
jgi:hypothetical protein